MVFFAITREGLESYLQLQRFDLPLWLSHGIADEAMKEKMLSMGVASSTFVYTIDPSDHDVIEDALDTIREHHPEESIWISCAYT